MASQPTRQTVQIITGNPLASRALVSEDRAIYASLIVHCSCCRGAKK
jgi:hypothetical protein